MAEYLNGFTIISFNHKNKYITLKSKNYYLNDGRQSSRSIRNLSSNRNAITNNIQQNNEYWIIKNNNFK